ncbi:LOW QUALITY PROTEIN: uncharacterized protein LOC124457174 [Xenia sp. Carnegie-2017]|uniref:LOW QUALITY PROTEIN: uncharacterized protein LOC124457174 n=1 Tax=Xenia sp. Carnegie-2017 TaxID=2897299 RepID=UPI001F03C9E0|nr:LOW QUALITY PROTEIN: uncharacterized protein LOC124457174 [Xenia sp. Carnegie-2017]
MGKGDHCAVYGCDNDRRYPEKYIVSDHKETKILCEKSFEHQDKAFFAAEITAPEQCTEPESVHEDSPQINCTTDLDVTSYDSDESDKHDLIDCFCQGEVKTLKRNLFIEQAICQKNCYRYTGLSLEKLNLVFSLIEEKAKSLRYWRGSTDTATAQSIKGGHVSRVLSHWEEFILTLVRTRKRFDNELSFVVPWPSKSEIKEKLPKRFQKFKNLRIIIDCTEFFIQKPKIPGSQKISWSSYKHWNTAKLLVGITPTGIFSFIPPLRTGSISDKEMVTNSGLINLLEKGDGVMADKGFLVRDLLVVKKVHLISPAYCRGPRLSSRGTTHTRRVASLRSHVERNILKLKQFQILSGVIPLTLKPVFDNILFMCAALCNLGKRGIK